MPLVESMPCNARKVSSGFCLFVFVSACLFVCLFVCLLVCLFCLIVCKLPGMLYADKLNCSGNIMNVSTNIPIALPGVVIVNATVKPILSLVASLGTKPVTTSL